MSLNAKVHELLDSCKVCSYFCRNHRRRLALFLSWMVVAQFLYEVWSLHSRFMLRNHSRWGNNLRLPGLAYPIRNLFMFYSNSLTSFLCSNVWYDLLVSSRYRENNYFDLPSSFWNFDINVFAFVLRLHITITFVIHICMYTHKLMYIFGTYIRV